MTKRRAVDFETYVISASVVRSDAWEEDAYPFNLPAVRNLDVLELHPRATFLVGENGSGKSTLIEAIAVAFGFNPEGGSRNFNFATRVSHSALHKHLRLQKSPRKARDGYFLRAESYFNVATNIEEMDRAPAPPGVFSPKVIESYGHDSLHEQSHGESFFALIKNRFGGRGFYVLDEPEAALSPKRQMDFLSRMHELVRDNSQLLIATHSPILMSYPNAWIYQIGPKGLDRVEWKDTEHYDVTRQFLNNPEVFLEVLLSDD